MGNRSRIIAVLTASITIIGVYSGIISIANFHCNKTFADDYIGSKHFDSSVEIHSIPISTVPFNDAHPISQNVDTVNSKVNLQQTEDSVQLANEMATNINKVDFEVVNIESHSSNETAAGDGVTVNMSEEPPAEGYGKLAIRSYCDHCVFGYLDVRVLSLDSTEIKHSSLNANYNPKYKRIYTYTEDLLPGKYIVELNYHRLGKDFMLVEVLEKKMSLYKYHKVNPYGDKNGKIVFFSRRPSQRWRITVDNKVLGTIEPHIDKGIGIKLYAGSHEYVIENMTASELDLENEKRNFYIIPGQRMPIYIE